MGSHLENKRNFLNNGKSCIGCAKKKSQTCIGINGMHLKCGEACNVRNHADIRLIQPVVFILAPFLQKHPMQVNTWNSDTHSEASSVCVMQVQYRDPLLPAASHLLYVEPLQVLQKTKRLCQSHCAFRGQLAAQM